VRLLRFNILFVYKMLFGLVWLDFPMFFTSSPVDNTRGHCYKLLLPSCNTDIRQYFFSVRIVNVWNELPACADFSSLRFNTSIHKIDLARYCNELWLFLIRTYMYYRETSICISSIILCYRDILIFYIAVILYSSAGGYKCRLTTFPTRFAHVVSILW